MNYTHGWIIWGQSLTTHHTTSNTKLTGQCQREYKQFHILGINYVIDMIWLIYLLKGELLHFIVSEIFRVFNCVELYRVIQLNWQKLWPYYSGLDALCEVRRLFLFFSWYPDILIIGFQKFQQGLYIFHRLLCWRAFILNFIENTLKINVFEKSILFCKYLHNRSSSLVEV